MDAGGYNVLDPLNCAELSSHGMGCKTWNPPDGGWNVHTFTGSRSSNVAATFDYMGSSPGYDTDT